MKRKTRNITKEQLLFLNVAEMSKYRGLAGDTIRGGGKSVSLRGFGNEIFNFKPYKGKMYGYGATPHGAIRLERLGAAKDDESVNDVTVIWVAKSRIVGWYKHATVYRRDQRPPRNSRRTYKGVTLSHNVTARESDYKRIDPPDAREAVLVPRARQREHAMGRYLWYASGPSNAAFREKVRRYIKAGGDPSVLRKSGEKGKTSNNAGSPRQPDIHKKQKIEHIAMRASSRYFARLNYKVDWVYKDNLGWDLDAVHHHTHVRLKLEVKGLSGGDVRAEMTPQEYSMMGKHKENYRICVVTNCLNAGLRTLSVFAYNGTLGTWMDQNDRPLQIRKVQSARLYV